MKWFTFNGRAYFLHIDKLKLSHLTNLIIPVLHIYEYQHTTKKVFKKNIYGSPVIQVHIKWHIKQNTREKKDSLDCESKKKKTKKNGRIIEVRRKRNSSLSNLISNINRIQNGQMASCNGSQEFQGKWN